MSKPIEIKNKKELIESGIITKDTMYGYSPLFDPILKLKIDINNKFLINTLSVKYEDATKRISIQILRKEVDLKNKHKNIKSVSKWLYDNLPTNIVDIKNATFDSEYLDRLILGSINKYSNHIAGCTRRGAANIALVGKKISNIIKPQLNDNINKLSYVDYVSNYRYIGMINNSILAYEDNSNTLKNNEVIITYNGGIIDHGVFISEDNNNNCYYITSNSGLGQDNNYSDYYRKIQFKNL